MTILETFKVWFKAARAPFLIVSFIPSILGGIMAYSYGSFDWHIFVLVTIGVVMAHSAGDFVDDYFDYRNGLLGHKEQQFHDSPLIHGKVTLTQVLIATLICLGVALAIGIYLLIEIGLPVLYMMIAGTFIVLFYTSPPIRLNYRGLGETALFFAFGPMIVFGVFFVLTRQFSWEPLLISIPLGIFTMNVGVVSNIFDFEEDSKSGKKCLPVLFGRETALKVVGIGTIISYLSIIAGVVFSILPVWTLLSLLTIPLGIAVYSQTKKFDDHSMYTPAMSKAIALSTFMGVILCVGYVMPLFV